MSIAGSYLLFLALYDSTLHLFPLAVCSTLRREKDHLCNSTEWMQQSLMFFIRHLHCRLDRFSFLQTSLRLSWTLFGGSHRTLSEGRMNTSQEMTLWHKVRWGGAVSPLLWKLTMSLELGGGGMTSAAAACVAEPEEVSGTSSPQTGTNKGKLVTATAKPCYYALIFIGSDAATQKLEGGSRGARD